jgi:Sulfatase
MSMHISASTIRRTLSGLPLAIGLGFAFLIVTLAQQASQLSELVARRSVLARTVNITIMGTPLGSKIFAFVAAQIALHVGFGVLAWLLARITVVAYPQWHGRRNRVTLAWFGVGCLWVWAGNAALFPWSNSSAHWALFTHPLLGSLKFFDILTALLSAAICICAVRAAATMQRVRVVMPRALVYGGLACLLGVTVNLVRAHEPKLATASSIPPNLIIIGIDSLRPELVGAGASVGLTPNIQMFLRGAHVFSNATTPLARTYPSWISILSGRYPRTTGARENLIPRERLASFKTLPEVLQSRGYRTIFATDEVRFSNIDEAYGFDVALTPTVGAADFLLGKLNDLPLPNMIANTRLGGYLFPATYANRAASVTYRPDTFIDRLADEIQTSDGKPTMLAIHLTLPHWPYRWADDGDHIFGQTNDQRYSYFASVIEADRQFGHLLALLEKKRLLDHSVVVVLSDHGEALGSAVGDTLLRGGATRNFLGGASVNIWGHGTSVLSPHQYATLLAMRVFEPAVNPEKTTFHDAPVSLVDLAPTLLDMARIDSSEPFDGTSVVPALKGDEAAIEWLRQRVCFTETGIRSPLPEAGKIDEMKIFDAAAAFFTMNSQTGRIEVREELMPVIIADKERAAFNQRWLLAAVPLAKEHAQRYILVDRQGGFPRRLTHAPDPAADPEVFGLWQVMHQHYGDELLPLQ